MTPFIGATLSARVGRGRGDADLGEDRVGERRPGTGGPRSEWAGAETCARHPGDRVDPEERAGASEVTEGGRRIGAPGPVRSLGVADLRTESPVAGRVAPEAGQDPGEALELDGHRFSVGVGADQSRCEELA